MFKSCSHCRLRIYVAMLLGCWAVGLPHRRPYYTISVAITKQRPMSGILVHVYVPLSLFLSTIPCTSSPNQKRCASQMEMDVCL